jgi:hypothetical protein
VQGAEPPRLWADENGQNVVEIRRGETNRYSPFDPETSKPPAFAIGERAGRSRTLSGTVGEGVDLSAH